MLDNQINKSIKGVFIFYVIWNEKKNSDFFIDLIFESDFWSLFTKVLFD